ncbi:hypothetical protein [Flavobacterium laiguense]|uniref:hypothetical protein n=1 Tax=Flavobacterium laiguense TaxID=2169409 RepID=UPI000F50B657|nr:hypothetical protein [Flavobacterium laiguense]
MIDRIKAAFIAVGGDIKSINSKLMALDADATNADFTALVNTSKYLPSATLTANRTITMPVGVDGNVIEFYNNESGFAWSLAGSLVYLADGITVVAFLYANTNYIIKKISGKWRIAN